MDIHCNTVYISLQEEKPRSTSAGEKYIKCAIHYGTLIQEISTQKLKGT